MSLDRERGEIGEKNPTPHKGSIEVLLLCQCLISVGDRVKSLRFIVIIACTQWFLLPCV
jgi:hypothetical protein